MKRAWAAWDRYWFSPAPLFNLAVTRIVIVGFQLVILVCWNPVTHVFPRLLELEHLYWPLPILRILTVPAGWNWLPGLGVLSAIYWMTLAVGVSALVGFFTRTSLAVFCMGSVFLQAFAYSFIDFHHAEAIMMIALGILSLAPSGETLSVDDMRRRMRSAAAERRLTSQSLMNQESPFAGSHEIFKEAGV
jgi:hypothetical protein